MPERIGTGSRLEQLPLQAPSGRARLMTPEAECEGSRDAGWVPGDPRATARPLPRAPGERIECDCAIPAFTRIWRFQGKRWLRDGGFLQHARRHDRT